MKDFPTVNALVAHSEFRALMESLRTADPRLRVHHSLDYVRWRYADIPGIDYRAAFDFDGEHRAAMVFGVTRNRSLRVLRMCDLFVASTRRSQIVARGLLRRVVAGSGCDYSAAMAAWRTPEASVLLSGGFTPVPQIGPSMVVRPLEIGALGIDPLRRSSWRLSIGALELF
jgi:hypothetical protein